MIVIFLFVETCGKNSDLKEEAKINEQNTSALNDSIKQIRLKNGDLQASVDGYIGTAKNLRKYNRELANKVRNEKGKIITLGNIVFQLKQDTADLQTYINELLSKYEKPIQINDSTWDVDWKLTYIYDSTNFDIFNGRTQIGLRGNKEFLKTISVIHNKTWMLNRDSQIGLTWGQKYEDGKLKVFAKTAHPAFKAKLLEGTYVNFPKKRHWFTGFGVGPTFNIGYDFLHNQPAIIIGVGINYNIYEW